MYGGVSLAIYINGVTQELLNLVRATAYADGNPHRGAGALPESDLRSTEKVYRKLAYLAGSYPQRGLLTHANHFQSVVAQVQGVGNSYNGDSLYRDFRARELLEPKIGSITVEDVKSVLRDEFGSPRAICRVPHEYQAQGSSMTIASLVFDLGKEVMHVAPGQPNRSEYQPVRLPGR
jgi:hypothetical protein